MIILCLLIRKKKARVYKPEDFKEYERGSDKNNQSSCFYFASKEIFEYVTLMVLGGREGGERERKEKKWGGRGKQERGDEKTFPCPIWWRYLMLPGEASSFSAPECFCTRMEVITPHY